MADDKDAAVKAQAEAIAEFAAKWSLDSASEDLLLSLSEGLLQDVVDTFDPPPDTKNVNAKLKVFIRSKSTDNPSQVRKPQTPDPQAQLRQFVEKWQLDDGATQLLQRLHPEVFRSVMSGFDPPPDTQNINARLHAFVRSIQKEARQEVVDPITGFVAHWGLDSSSEALLRSLARDQLAEVMREFNPPPGTQNPSGKLTAFVRSFESSKGASFGKGAPLQADRRRSGSTNGSWSHWPPPVRDPISSFSMHWGLDGAAEQAVRDLPPHIQEMVMNGFSPPPGTMNPSGKLTAFIRGVMKEDGGAAALAVHGKRIRMDPIQEFMMKWQLDGEAEQILRGLSWDKQEDIMNAFRPRPDTRNYSAMFHTFVRSRLETHDQSWENRGRSENFDSLHSLQSRSMRNQYPEHSRPPSHEEEAFPADADDDISAFVQRWGLDAESNNLLRSLPQDLLEGVLQDFQPDEYTRNPNAKLATWVRSLRDGGESSRKRPRR